MPQTYSNILLHVVFSTKQRIPFAEHSQRQRLYQYMAAIIKDRFGFPLIINGCDEHVHVLLNLRPTIAISDAMRVVKACSSKWFHETFRRVPFGWQDGFSVFSVSESNRQQVADYIRDQEEHHKKMDFRRELVLLLKRNAVQLGERDFPGDEGGTQEGAAPAGA